MIAAPYKHTITHYIVHIKFPWKLQACTPWSCTPILSLWKLFKYIVYLFAREWQWILFKDAQGRCISKRALAWHHSTKLTYQLQNHEIQYPLIYRIISSQIYLYPITSTRLALYICWSSIGNYSMTLFGSIQVGEASSTPPHAWVTEKR
jgi:hypothetical protein